METILNKVVNRLFSFPGSILLVPMMLSALVNTFFKNLLLIGEPMNSIFNGSGIMVLLFIMLFVSGLELKFNQLKGVIKESFLLIIVRIVLATVIYFLYLKIFGSSGIFSISSFTLLIVLLSTNPGLFIALVQQYGKKENTSLFGPLNVLPLPAIPLAILSLSSKSSFSLLSLFAVLLPFILGIVIGNTYPLLKNKIGNVTPTILFFWGLGLGSKLDLTMMFNDLIPGFILTILFYLLITLPMYFLERLLLKSNGVLSLSTCSVAAIALIIPAMINQGYSEAILESAVNQLSLVVILTSLLTPLLVDFIAKNS